MQPNSHQRLHGHLPWQHRRLPACLHHNVKTFLMKFGCSMAGIGVRNKELKNILADADAILGIVHCKLYIPAHQED